VPGVCHFFGVGVGASGAEAGWLSTRICHRACWWLFGVRAGGVGEFVGGCFLVASYGMRIPWSLDGGFNMAFAL
jgi:hypothetical protein